MAAVQCSPGQGYQGMDQSQKENTVDTKRKSHRGRHTPARQLPLALTGPRKDTAKTAQPGQAPTHIPARRALTTPPSRTRLHTYIARVARYFWGLATAVPLSGARCTNSTSREGRLGLGSRGMSLPEAYLASARCAARFGYPSFGLPALPNWLILSCLFWPTQTHGSPGNGAVSIARVYGIAAM